MKRQILANEDSQADRAAEPEALVMAVSQTDSEPASLKAGAQVHYAEHLHAVR